MRFDRAAPALWLAIAAIFPFAPAFAAGEILITHTKALAGNVTPGDPPGYPVILSQPGAYELAGNLFPPAGKPGIGLGAANIMLDMKGYTLFGGGTAMIGVYGDLGSATIRNGTVTGFQFDGIAGRGAFWRVEDMRVVDNGRYGVYVPGAHFRIVGSQVVGNDYTGILCGTSCHVEGNVVSGNFEAGVSMSGGLVLGNTIVDNGDLGAYSFYLGGLGNNVMSGNNAANGYLQAAGFTELEPNACQTACLPP